jgi:hypothetical protein
MKRNIVRTVFFATIFLGVAALALAQGYGPCSNASVAGEYGTILTGTQILPTGAVPFAAVNRTTYDMAGNLWGTQTRTSNGTVSRVTFRGTYTLNSDCTVTKTVISYDKLGNVVNTATMDGVFVGNSKELFEVFTSVTLANGTNIPVVISGHAKKLFPLEWPWY